MGQIEGNSEDRRAFPFSSHPGSLLSLSVPISVSRCFSLAFAASEHCLIEYSVLFSARSVYNKELI